MASRKLTKREERAITHQEREKKSRLDVKTTAKIMCENILHCIHLAEIALGDEKYLPIGEKRLEKELAFYANINLLPNADESVLQTYDNFFVIGSADDNKRGNFVVYSEDEEYCEFGESCDIRDGLSVSVAHLGGKLFAETYHSSKWSNDSFFSNKSKCSDRISDYEPVGEINVIDILQYIGDYKIFTAFCGWCKKHDFDIYADLIASGKKWKALM